MPTIRLPNNWCPRPYQRPAWDYLERGGRHAELIWHRRSGKDEVALHRTAVAAFERVATYWHMLPMASQARKAIWDAVNPHTGMRRIDEAFPLPLRQSTRENEMAIRFVNGSTWQVVGSDNFNSLVGSPPAGIVYSEWALANPSARAYLRPILLENRGWQMYITTPRGRNHAYDTFRATQGMPGVFAQKLTALDTGCLSGVELEAERAAYRAEYGREQGDAYFEQEYMCSFEAAILGAVYGAWMQRAEQDGRITRVDVEENAPVHTAWDLGYDDATAIWFWQHIGGEIRLVDYYDANGQDVAHYCGVLKARGYSYGRHYVPHDAANKLMAAGGRSIVQQANQLGVQMHVVPATSQQNGIEAARKTLERCWFDAERCADGINSLQQYQFEWDDQKKIFRSTPRHDWTSHACDAFEIIGQVWRTEQAAIEKPKPRFLHEMTADEIFWPQRRAIGARQRI